MNRSYKLFDTMWDGIIIDKNIQYLDYDSYINDFNDETNIFDLYGKRKINISYILSIKNIDDLNRIIDALKSFKCIIISFDYQPHNNNKVINDYYTIRTKQIYTYLKSHLKNNNIYISSNFKNYSK